MCLCNNYILMMMSLMSYLQSSHILYQCHYHYLSSRYHCTYFHSGKGPWVYLTALHFPFPTFHALLMGDAMKERNIPFSFLVGDLPTYKDILSLQSEIPKLFKNIIPIIGTFYQQMSYIHAVCRVFELYHHLQRVKYLTYCFKHFELREYPSLISNGWNVGKCRAVRYTHGPLPERDNNCSDISSSDSDNGTGTEHESSADI